MLSASRGDWILRSCNPFQCSPKPGPLEPDSLLDLACSLFSFCYFFQGLLGFVLPQAVFLFIEFLKNFTGFARADVPQGFANCCYCFCLDGFPFYCRELEATYAELAFDRCQQEVLKRALPWQLRLP